MGLLGQFGSPYLGMNSVNAGLEARGKIATVSVNDVESDDLVGDTVA